jgi:hypothetical protein
MRVHVTDPLFAWNRLDDSPDLRTVRDLLASVPDGALLESLRKARGRGRDDYPVSVLWGVLLLTIALRHTSIEACLSELRRNADLRRLIGIDGEQRVPRKWNMSRFLEVLGQEPHRTLLREAFDAMVQRLGRAVPDLGRNTAGDSSGLSARPLAEDAELHGLPAPAGGRKEYTDESGAVTRVVAWHGYKFHLLVDVKHEVILAWQLSSTKQGDNQLVPKLLEQARGNLPEGRIQTLAYDKAADDDATHRLLHEAGIAPLIENRRLWKDEFERPLPRREAGGAARKNGARKGGMNTSRNCDLSHLVHDEAGTVYCYDKVSDPCVRHKMAYIGREPDRATLKYRCPARHEGWSCPSEQRCNAGKIYGLTVRVPRERDLRRFPPIPRTTKKFERLYKGRTAVERVNARVKIFWGADDGNIVGTTRFAAFLSAVMIVHAGFATLLASCPRRDGTLGRMRISPIAEALTAVCSN